MNDKLRKYLEFEWKYANHKKYQKYFGQWIENLTVTQIYYFGLQMEKAEMVGRYK